MDDEMDKIFPWLFKSLIAMLIFLVLGLLVPEAIIAWKKAFIYKEPTSIHDITIEDHRSKR